MGMLAAFRTSPAWLKSLLVIAWGIIMLALFITTASAMFVWLSGLGYHYRPSSIETYWQWVAYLRYYRHGLVLLWLVPSGILPAATIVLLHVRAFQRASTPRSLYGDTRWSTPAQITVAGFRLRRRL